jgi:hypothetical protein
MSFAAAFTMTFSNGAPTDAVFRAWGVLFNAKLALAGLVQTADTGQINWTTVSTAVINTAAGYEIWRFNDTLQATAPVFLKIEYGSGAATTGPSIWLTVGSGSDGAGNLTGIKSTRQQFTCATGAACTCYVSGDTNRFVLAVPNTAVSTSFLVSFERTVDAAGAVTNEGVLLAGNAPTPGTTWAQQMWNCTLGPMTASWESSIGVLTPILAPFGTSGSQIAVYPVFHTKGVYLNPGLNLLGYFAATIGAASPITFSYYGVNHTFMPLAAVSFTSFSRNTNTGASPMMRYE